MTSHVEDKWVSKVDFQNHWTTKSRVLCPINVFRQASERLGTNGIAGLVNYNDQRYEAFAERALDFDIGNAVYSSAFETMIVKGEEIGTQEGDLLVMGLPKGKNLTRYPEKRKRTLEDTMREAVDENGIVIITTPFFRSRVGETMLQNPELWKYVDAVEVHNGNVSRKPKDKAIGLYHIGRQENPSMGVLASSDGHSFREVGTSYTRMSVPKLDTIKKPEKVVEALKEALKETSFPDFKERRNYVDPAIHAGIIGAVILTEKLPSFVRRSWPFSSIVDRGDPESLLS